MRNKYGMMFSNDIKENIKNLIHDASNFKREVFKAAMMNNEINYKIARSYMATINDFLRYWDEFSKDLAIKMKESKGQEGIRTIDYGFVKQYIYAKYDYASILQFADGVIRGIKDKKFLEVEDVEDFFESCVSKAYPDLPYNTAGVLDAVVNPDIGVDFEHSTTKMDAKMYDSVKSYSSLFDSRNRPELYKAISKTIEYILYDRNEGNYPLANQMKMYVCMINNIIDYAVYSLAVYACRIYIIQSYAYPFIHAAKSYSESYDEYYDDEYIEEKSNGLLQVAHRLAIIDDPNDPRDGHYVHIIYDLNGDWELTQNNTVSDQSGLGHRKSYAGPLGKEGRMQIRKLGNTDFCSKGHLVKAVKDLDDGNKIIKDKIMVIGPYAKDNIKYRADPVPIKMGTIDNNDLFKSTNWVGKDVNKLSSMEGHTIRGQKAKRHMDYGEVTSKERLDKDYELTNKSFKRMIKTCKDARKQAKELRNILDDLSKKKKYKNVDSDIIDKEKSFVHDKCHSVLIHLSDLWRSPSSYLKDNGKLEKIKLPDFTTYKWKSLEGLRYAISKIDEIADFLPSKTKHDKAMAKIFRDTTNMERYVQSSEYKDFIKKWAPHNRVDKNMHPINKNGEIKESVIDDYLNSEEFMEAYINFIIENADTDDEDKYKGPSVKDMEIGNKREVECTIMRDTDDRLTKDITEAKKYFDKFVEFIKDIGAESLYTDGRMLKYPTHWVSSNDKNSNRFISKLMDNPLFNIIDYNGSYVYSSSNDPAARREIEEFNQNIKSFAHNSIQGIQGTSTPKQEILHVIRGVKCNTELKECQEVAKDLYEFALSTLCSIESRIRSYSKITNIENLPDNYTVSTRNATIETLNVLSELYRDISFAILQKARDIEVNVNKARNAAIDKAISSTTIKIPDLGKHDNSSNNNMMTSVPDTTRVPMDLLDIYEIPLVEAMNLYDEVLKLNPMFRDDPYFTEDVNHDLNSISSKLKAAWQRVEMFFLNAQYKKSKEWIESKSDELMNMDLSGCTLDVLPYKGNITLPDGFDNLAKNIKNIPEGAYNDKNALANWAKTLYPSEVVYKWWYPDGNQQIDAGRMWRNAFLFQELKGPNNENTVKDEEVKPVKSDAKAIAENLSFWIDTIKKSNETYDALRKMNSEVSDALKELKRSAVNHSKTQNVNEAGENGGSEHSKTDTPTPTPTNDNSSSSQSSTEESKVTANGSNPNNQSGVTTNDVIKQAELAVARLYLPLGIMIIECIKNEYDYIVKVHNMAKKNMKEE